MYLRIPIYSVAQKQKIMKKHIILLTLFFSISSIGLKAQVDTAQLRVAEKLVYHSRYLTDSALNLKRTAEVLHFQAHNFRLVAKNKRADSLDNAATHLMIRAIILKETAIDELENAAHIIQVQNLKAIKRDL